MGIRFTPSAGRHGITPEDALFIMLHATRRIEFTDRTGRKAIRFIRRIHPQTTRLAEVIAHFNGDDIVVYHAMETGERENS